MSEPNEPEDDLTDESEPEVPAIDPNLPPPTYDQRRLALKKVVRMFYDLQRLRLQTQGRVLRKAPEAAIQLHAIDQQLLAGRAKELLRAEKSALLDVKHQLKHFPVYTEVLTQRPRFLGLGPTMAGVIISEYDIRREDTASKMWAFAGLAPVRAERCGLCHEVVLADDTGVYKHKRKVACKEPDRIYESGEARRFAKGETAPYNRFLKTKLVGVLGGCLLKANSPWRDLYDGYKLRKQSAGWGISDGHRHNAAIRYMVKMLLLDVWKDWRTLEKLPVRPSYHEEKLGHVHSASLPAAPVLQERAEIVATPIQ